MQESRVILANEPRLLRGMLRRAIARAPGLRVVGEAENLDELSALLPETGAEWAIVSLWPEGLAPRALQVLLLDQPALSILGMAADGSHAKIARLVTKEEARDGLSLDELLAILRRRTHGP